MNFFSDKIENIRQQIQSINLKSDYLITSYVENNITT